MIRNLLALVAILSFTLHGQISVALPGPESLVGQPVNLVISTLPDTSVEFIDGCIVDEVRLGTPAGPTVWREDVCPDIVIPIGPGQEFLFPWNPVDTSNVILPAGTYALKLSYRITSAGMVMEETWIQVVLITRMAPRLIPVQDALLGGECRLAVCSPYTPWAPALCGAALSTTVGIKTPDFDSALDFDQLFLTILTNPEAIGAQGFITTLDQEGHSPLMLLPIPDLPEITGLTLHFQALVIGQEGTEVSNLVSTTIKKRD